MITLKVEKRNPEVKAKKLRRDGFVCGVLYGKEMKESTPIQLMEPEALRFIKANKEGMSVADWLYLVLPCAWCDAVLRFHFHSFLAVIHSPGY